MDRSNESVLRILNRPTSSCMPSGIAAASNSSKMMFSDECVQRALCMKDARVKSRMGERKVRVAHRRRGHRIFEGDNKEQSS